MDKKGEVSYLIFVDCIDAIAENDFQKWATSVCMPAMLKSSSVLDVALYKAVRGGPKYLIFCEAKDMDSISVITDIALKDDKCASSLNRLVSNKVVLAAKQFRPDVVSETDRGMAPYLQIGRMSVDSEIESAWNFWYDHEFIPSFMGVPGLRYARRYHVVEGNVKYMTVYEMDAANVGSCDEWVRRRNISSPDTPKMRDANQMASGSPGVYEKI